MTPVFTIAMPTSLEKSSSGSNWQSGSTTLITESLAGCVIEVDSSGFIVWQKTGLNDPIDAERLSNGNTLITEYIGKKVSEVDSAGNEVWNKSDLSAPKDAERLDNGNTLIVEYTGGRIIEVDNSGNIVWEITGLDGPIDVEIFDTGMLITEYLGGRIIVIGDNGWNITGLDGPADAERLDNGNILIVEYTGGRIIEVNSSGNIVWEKTGLLGPIDAERLNKTPNAPIIVGPTNGKVGIEYEYTFSVKDNGCYDVSIFVDWGDGSTNWTAVIEPGTDIKLNHSWHENGTYIIRAKAVDIFGAESDWTELVVTMPRNKLFNFNFNLLEWLFERFPILKILCYIL